MKIAASSPWQRPFLFAVLVSLAFSNVARASSRELELSRAARPGEFLCTTGMRAGVFGNEGGNLEAWVYPLKLFRNLRLRFLTDGRSLSAETLARTVVVRPESSTIVYSGDSFSIRETLFVPVREPGGVIRFDIQSSHPIEIEALFERDFQLEWPAALGGTFINWEPSLHAFYLGEEQKKFAAVIGSPSGSLSELEYQTNYSASTDSALRLGVTAKGRETRLLVFAASVNGRSEAESVYKNLIANYAAAEIESAEYYRDYLSHTVSLELPDAQLQEAYDWARVSVIQGLVTNPYLGTGLVAGYRTSGLGQRPGFAWFFGRDSFWIALALDAEDDFATSRMALDFISKYQRADGKIPHEVSQGTGFVKWFTDYPYPYASADATPLYIIAVDDYLTESGDMAFAREKWESLWNAYQFLRSTYDIKGLPQNFGVGHGWVEGGPLLPVKAELYQSGLGAQALASLARCAHFAGKDDVSKQLEEDFERQKELINQTFWSAESSSYAFALDNNDRRVIEPSVLATVPMWFGLLDQQKSSSMISQLAGSDHQTDWGMRIISSRSTRYDPGGYHYGSVWPLFTGWASVGEYRYHRALPAYFNLRANALLALDGSLGHVTEVLSGDYYQGLSTSSPHQIWSSAMVISSLLRGLLGMGTDALSHTVFFNPHVPADWRSFAVENVRVGDTRLDLNYNRTADAITLNIVSTGDCEIQFSPGLSPRVQVVGADVNGRRVSTQMSANDYDEHASIRVTLRKGKTSIRLLLRDDFGISYSNSLPPLGSSSRGMRVISESWTASRDALTLELAGKPNASYMLGVWNAGQIASVDEATLKGSILLVQMPAGNPSEDYVRQRVRIHFHHGSRGH